MMKATDISKASIIVNTIKDIEFRIDELEKKHNQGDVWWLTRNDDYIELGKDLTEQVICLVMLRLDQQKENCLNELKKLGVEYVNEAAKTTTEN